MVSDDIFNLINQNSSAVKSVYVFSSLLIGTQYP